MSVRLGVPDLCLVVLVGCTGSGKSTFARAHFKPTQVVSSDFCRGLVSDDENDQSATGDAFDVLRYIAGKRLAAGRLTVVDATSVQAEARRPLVQLAREHDVLPVAIVLDVPERVCADRNAARPGRAHLPPHVIARQQREPRHSLRQLSREGFRKVHHLRGVEQVEAAEIVLERRYNDLRHLTGPFDIIGDVHGCAGELEALLAKLGYVDGTHPEGRTAVFVGDLVDRGPDSVGVLRRVIDMVAAGTALCVPGNHENKLGRHLAGRNVQLGHGLAGTVEQLERAGEAFGQWVREFIDGLISTTCWTAGRSWCATPGFRSATTAAPRDGSARPLRCRRPADRGDRAPRRRGRPGGERGRRAGGDEPLRRGPPAAGVPAADHGAVRDRAAGRLPGAPARGLRRLPGRRGRPGDLRGEAPGLAGGRARLPGRPDRRRAVRDHRRRDHRRRVHPDRPPVLRRPLGSPSRSSPGCAAR